MEVSVGMTEEAPRQNPQVAPHWVITWPAQPVLLNLGCSFGKRKVTMPASPLLWGDEEEEEADATTH